MSADALIAIAMPSTSATPLAPRSLGELLSLPTEDVNQVDIGRANLLCAEGLPGAEELDIEEHASRLDAWTERIRSMTEQHLPRFAQHAHHFENSEPKWRLLVAAKLLHEECNVGYHEPRIDGDPDWSDSQDLLIHGITGPRRKGTCPSLPVFFVAIGRRLGYPMYVSTAPGHCFSRWDAEQHKNSSWRDRFNIEFHGHIDYKTDEYYYDWPVVWPQHSRELHRKGHPSMAHLRSLTPAEVLAHSLCQRATCLEAVERYEEAINAFYCCSKYDRVWDGYQNFAKRTLRSRAERVIRSCGYQPDQFRRWVFGDAFLGPRQNLNTSLSPLVAAMSDAVFAGLGSGGDAWHPADGPRDLPPGKLKKYRTPNHDEHQPTPPWHRPDDLDEIIERVLLLTCAGTPAKPSLELLKPHPPEPKVIPYGSLREEQPA